MSISDAADSDTPTPTKQSWADLDWSGRVQRISLIATTVVGISAAAIALKTNVLDFIGIESENSTKSVTEPPKEATASKNTQHTDTNTMGASDPVVPDLGADPPLGRRTTESTVSTSETVTETGVRVTRRETRETTVSTDCAEGWRVQGDHCVPLIVIPPGLEQLHCDQPPCSVPSGPFIIYFDWDEAVLTPTIMERLREVARVYHSMRPGQLVLAGHADRSGSAEYNMGLSERRTENARDYLIRYSVPEAAITAQAFGENRPAVDTADGVREPDNRRVEITFGPAPSG